MSDPFANASASAGAGAPDPFGTKPSEVKSDFPKLEDFEGRLLVIQPTKHETGLPDPFNKDKTRDRITADVTVIDRTEPRNSETIKDMFISQGALVGQIKGFVETRGMLLGVLRKHRAKNTPEGYNTPDEIDKLITDWVAAGARGNKPPFAWKLADFTDADKDAALAWYRSKS